MTRSSSVRIEQAEGWVTVVIDRPPVNVLDREAMIELADNVERLGKDPQNHLVVLRGAGKCFSAGADVAEHLPPDVGAMLGALRRLLLAIDAVPVPTLAVVHGVALGGGMEVALAADRRLCAVDAKIGFPEIRLGVMAPAAAVLLPDLVGPSRALRLLSRGEEITGRAAAEMGLCDEALAPGELDAAVAAEGALLAGRSRTALVASKTGVRYGASGGDLRERLEVAEHLYLEDVAESADGLAGLRGFLAKGKGRG